MTIFTETISHTIAPVQTIERDGSIYNRTLTDTVPISHKFGQFFFETITQTIPITQVIKPSRKIIQTITISQVISYVLHKKMGHTIAIAQAISRSGSLYNRSISDTIIPEQEFHCLLYNSNGSLISVTSSDPDTPYSPGSPSVDVIVF